MEIPSSSPIYSPLKPESDTYKLDSGDQVLLFPSQSHNTEDPPETQDIKVDSQVPQDDSPSDPPNDPPGNHSDHSSDISLALDDPEVTIFSDSEYEVPDTESSDVEILPERNTQNYLDALLTESLLESLPLPIDQKNSIRKRRPQNTS